MAAGDITTVDVINALLKQQLKEKRDQFSKLTILNDAIKREVGKEVGGPKGSLVQRPHRTSPNRALAGVRGDAGNRAKPSTGVYTQTLIPVYPHNASGKLGKIGELKTKSALQALQSVVKSVQDDVITGFAIQTNCLHYGDGSGVLARVNGTPDLNTMNVTVDRELVSLTDITFGLRHLAVGMYFQATSDRTLTQPDKQVDGQVQGITAGGPYFNASGNIADLADNDYIVYPDGLNNVSEGIWSTDQGVKTTYLNINRSTAGNEWAKIYKRTSGGDLEDDVIDVCMSLQETIGIVPTMGLTNRRVYQKLFDLAKGDRRFVMQGTKRDYALGFSSIPVFSPDGKGVDIFTDAHMPLDNTSLNAGAKGVLWLLNPSVWSMVSLQEPGWYTDPNGNFAHEIPGTFGLGCTWFDVHNLVCDVPQAVGQVNGISL